MISKNIQVRAINNQVCNHWEPSKNLMLGILYIYISNSLTSVLLLTSEVNMWVPSLSWNISQHVLFMNAGNALSTPMCASSRIVCALVPPMPKELTPAAQRQPKAMDFSQEMFPWNQPIDQKRCTKVEPLNHTKTEMDLSSYAKKAGVAKKTWYLILLWFYLPPLQRIRRTCTRAEIGSTSAQTFSSPTSKRLLPKPLQAPRVSIESCNLSQKYNFNRKRCPCCEHRPVQCSMLVSQAQPDDRRVTN